MCTVDSIYHGQWQRMWLPKIYIACNSGRSNFEGDIILSRYGVTASLWPHPPSMHVRKLNTELALTMSIWHWAELACNAEADGSWLPHAPLGKFFIAFHRGPLLTRKSFPRKRESFKNSQFSRKWERKAKARRRINAREMWRMTATMIRDRAVRHARFRSSILYMDSEKTKCAASGSLQQGVSHLACLFTWFLTLSSKSAIWRQMVLSKLLNPLILVCCRRGA